VLSFVSLKKHDNVRANSSLNSASEELASVGIYLHNNSANGTLQTESSSLQKTASNHEQVLYFSTSLVAIAVLSTITLVVFSLKRLTFSKAFNNRLAASNSCHRIRCDRCQFFNNNLYLKCAVHPSKVLTPEAKDCTDFSPPT
jgi:predicted PurR-regulated permease PerM